MVLFILENGKKGPNDVIVKVVSYGEVLTFSELLFLLKHYFKSEGSYYPISEGKRGQCMLLSAICEVAFGRDLDLVLKDYKLDRKGKKLSIIDKRNVEREAEVKPITKLHEVLE
jgi:hypothetical protein